MVQPYDASGWGFTYTNQRSPIMTLAPIDSFIFFTNNEDTIFRLLAADIALIANGGPAPNAKLFISTIHLGGVGLGAQVLAARRFNHFADPLNVGELIELADPVVIVGPDTQLRVDVLANVAGSTWTCGISGVFAPVGTVFYV